VVVSLVLGCSDRCVAPSSDAPGQSASDGAKPGLGATLSAADMDGDGEFDTCQIFRPGVLRNDIPKKGASVSVVHEGKGANTHAAGARLTATIGAKTQRRQINAVAGFGQGVAPQVRFGIGTAPAIDCLEIAWPSGQKSTTTGIPAGALFTLEGP